MDIDKKFYIFIGDDIGLQNRYIKQLGNYVRADSVADIWDKLTNKTLFGSKTYVIRDDMEFISNESNWKGIEQKIKGGKLILQFTSLNKTTKFYKANKDNIKEFNHNIRLLTDYIIANGLTGNNEDIKYFINACESDYDRVVNEIDKIKRLGLKNLNKCVTDDIVGIEYEVTVFNLLDAVINKSESTYEILNIILETNQPIMGIFTLLHTRIRECILVEGYKDHKNLSQATGVPTFKLKSILEYNNLTPQELLRAIRIIEKYQQGIIVGTYEDKIAIQCCIAQIIT